MKLPTALYFLFFFEFDMVKILINFNVMPYLNILVKNSLIAFLVFTVSIPLISCKKLEDYQGNNQHFETTNFEFEEIITLEIDNNLLNFQGIGNCLPLQIWPLPAFTINYEAFIPTQNPNPYTHLVYNVKPKSVKLELVNIEDCDFSMLQDVKVYLVKNGVTGTINDFIIQNPGNPSAAHNAVKIGQYQNIPDGIGLTMDLTTNNDAILDEFIYDGSFQTFMSLNFDKAFTASQAIIKATLLMEVTLINE